MNETIGTGLNSNVLTTIIELEPYGGTGGMAGKYSLIEL
jgi:hypothetical protein